jgi:hypothetical protein
MIFYVVYKIKKHSHIILRIDLENNLDFQRNLVWFLIMLICIKIVETIN